MAKFHVTFILGASCAATVDAADVDAAIQEATEAAGLPATLCWHCATHLDIGDVVKTVVVDHAGREVYEEKTWAERRIVQLEAQLADAQVRAGHGCDGCEAAREYYAKQEPKPGPTSTTDHSATALSKGGSHG
jgi:hypothetical protein